MGLFKPDVEKLAAKRDLKGLIAALAHRKADVRKCAADAIRRLAKEGIFDSATVKPLIASLSDEDESVRKDAAFALGDLATKSATATDVAAVKPLTRLLSDANWEVRWSAAFAINRLAWRGIFDATTVKPLIGLLQSRSGRIRENAAYALAYLARAGVSDTRHAHRSLKKIASSDGDHRVRKAAKKALSEMRKETLVGLSKLMSYILRHDAEQSYPVGLDRGCYAQMSQLVHAISSTPEWSWVGRRHIEEVANKSRWKNKKRFVMKGDRIKAVYGVTRDCPSTKTITGELTRDPVKNTRLLKPEPTPQPAPQPAPEHRPTTEPAAIEVRRGYEVLPNNDLKFGIRVINPTPYLIADVETIFDYDKTLFSLKGDDVQTLANIHPGGERTAKYVLTPRLCVHNEKIGATIRYNDHTGERRTDQMRPKEVHCVCPFLKEKAIREGEFAELAAKSEYIDAGLSFSGIDVSEIADFIKESCSHRLSAVSEHGIDNTIVLNLAGESMGEEAYYLLTAVIQPYKGITRIMLRAYSDKSHGLHGFLNEITASIRHLVGSVQSAREIGVIESTQVINIIDSVVQRTSFGGAGDGGSAEVNVKDSVVHRSNVGGGDAER
ncbi:MAG: hypothetical protein GWP10_20395 [Nitrospiraceae bacterium]|nr:hypothetical protein [Nitrospiraceae bacterium]